jgi:hypothetical protein
VLILLLGVAAGPAVYLGDPEGYRAYIDNAEAEFRQGVVH